jgi:type VI secretion system protein ImpL
VSLEEFGQVFGYGELFDHFFTTNLDRFVDSSRVPWNWREGSLHPSRQLLDQFLAAQRIREMFFLPGAKTPKLSFFVTMSDLDLAANRFTLEVDGQQTEEKHGPQVKWPIDWPGPKPGRVVVNFEARFFDPPKPYGGAWGWFRFVDEKRTGSADQRSPQLQIRDSYHSVRVTVEPSRVAGDPFGLTWRQFSCES